MRRNKRGVSPLIATVLLISFTVALGSVVLNWGKNLDIASSGACSGVSIKLRPISGFDVCYDGAGLTKLNFIVDNTGKKDISGLGVWVIGEHGTSFLDLDDVAIAAGNLLNIMGDKVTYDFNRYGGIKNVQFIPKIKSGDSTEICTENSIKTANIGACQ